MKKLLQILIAAALFIPLSGKAQFETAKDSVVQLYGIVMTADSLTGIPAVSISIKGQNRGTMSNSDGVFSIVVLKGDEIEFSHVSFKTEHIVVPKNLEGTQHSIIQLMVIDATYLPATIIKPRPTPEQFARDFLNNKIDDDDFELARKNAEAVNDRVLIRNTPGAGSEAVRQQFNRIATKATYQGQTPPMNIFNPAAWADFIQSWKRGDYKRKK